MNEPPWWIFVVTSLVALFLVRLVVANTRDIGEEARRQWCRILTDLIAVVIVVYFLVRPFIVQTGFIPTESMVPTLEVNDRILVCSFIYRYRAPRRGEVIVFHPPRAARETEPNPSEAPDYVKRLIALPGETVRTDAEGLVHVDGNLLEEPYVSAERRADYLFPENLLGVGAEPGEAPIPGAESDCPLVVREAPGAAGRYEAVVPVGGYFVLGDNRTRSSDSHEWGCVPAERATVGRAMFVFWPIERAGLVR